MLKVTNTELILTEDVIAKAKELGQMLVQAEEVEVYLQAEQKIKNHEKVQNLISTIKKKQKEIVAFEQLNHRPMIDQVQSELDALHEELDLIPIVQSFQQAQVDVNYILQLVIKIIADTVSEKINVETGGEVSGGCGSGGG
jgi:cell fate (sporulation/competence/biofilm development) regulator YmcA (YheA/YmcA/DUF963 family)